MPPDPKAMPLLRSPARSLALLLVQSVKMQGRLLMAFGALSVAELLLVLCLGLFPLELALALLVTGSAHAETSVSRKLAERALLVLERVPRSIDPPLRRSKVHPDGPGGSQTREA